MEVTSARGATLNRSSRTVRQLCEAIAADSPGAAAGVAQLAAHVLTLWLAENDKSVDSQQGATAMIRLMQAADSAAEEPLD